MPKPALLLLVIFLCFAGSAAAQPAPTLSSVPPLYLKQGESQDVTLSGQNLSASTTLVLAGPAGVEASVVKTDKPDPAGIKVHLAARADAALGNRELRLVTPMGVTAPIPVTVGQYAAFADLEPNNVPEQAQPIQLPAAITGRIEAPGDSDFYKFDAKKGQHLLFDVSAARIGSSLEPVARIHDDSGKELACAEEHHDGDPMLVFDVPADGTYLLHVRDLQYRGGGEYGYRVDCGEIPYVESLLPMTARRGQKLDVKAIGHNLSGADVIPLDLSEAEPGEMPVRAKTAHGLSNALSFIVTDVPQIAEQEPNDTPQTANAITFPAELSGALQKQGDEDFYKFRLPAKRKVKIEVQARSTGSPVDALLTLKNEKGEEIETSNGTADADAKIARELDPGAYTVSIRDLTYAGGPGYAYRVSFSHAAGLPPDFAVRFLPDAPRVPRGGSVKLWCDIIRANGFKGAVTVTLDGLPSGVTASPLVFDEQSSGIFTLTASPDAPLGTTPLNLKASSVLGGQDAVRAAEPELKDRAVQQAYLTVMEPASFSVEAVALIKPEQLKEYAKQAQELSAKLNATSPELEKAQGEWEKTLADEVDWKTVDAAKLSSVAGTALSKQPDGSILAGGTVADKDTFTIAGTTDVKGITAIRLEMLTDPSLPKSGPGRAESGNFVLSHFTLTAAPKSDPAQSKPVALKGAMATFEQQNYKVTSALDAKPAAGWAIFPETGKQQTAIFFTAGPTGFDGGTVLTFTLDQRYGQQHLLGRFRLSVTSAPVAAARNKAAVPADLMAIVKTPADKRTPAQRLQLAGYYRSIAPALAPDRAKLAALRASIGPYAEIARLESLLTTSTTSLDAERKEWEQSALAGGWSEVEVGETTSTGGTLLTRESDGSLFASGPAPAVDTYTIDARTPLKQITGVKIEALPDERLPGNGPGRAGDGNFVLSRLQLTASARGGPTTQPSGNMKSANAAKPAPIEFSAAKATFEQKGWPAVGALDDRNDTGWSVAPNVGRPESAVFTVRTPIVGGEQGTALHLTLEQQSPQPQHTLGRFRIWVTSAVNPDAAVDLPAEIAAALRTPPDKRNETQKGELIAYHRSISPSLAPVRERLKELKSAAAPLPLTVARNKNAFIPTPLLRSQGFTGEVQIALEGFTAGRDPATHAPASISKSIAVVPLAIRGEDGYGKLSIRPNGNCELGTRMVVLRAEGKVGNDTYVEYSPAFPLTVTEK